MRLHPGPDPRIPRRGLPAQRRPRRGRRRRPRHAPDHVPPRRDPGVPARSPGGGGAAHAPGGVQEARWPGLHLGVHLARRAAHRLLAPCWGVAGEVTVASTSAKLLNTTPNCYASKESSIRSECRCK